MPATPRIFVTGAGGQLGSELARALAGDSAGFASRSDLDVCNPAAVERAVGDARPDVVIHAAAMTNVDRCEAEPAEANRVNALGAWHVALACRNVGAAMVYVSTNYVFDGRKSGPYYEYDLASPISAYGASKLGGEMACAAILAELFVVRSAWVYSRWRRNFVSSLLERARSGAELRYVNDQFATPTHARDLALGIVRLVQTHAYGIYHLTCEGSASWHGWAEAVLGAAGMDASRLMAIPAREYPRAAAVPANGVLANSAGAGLDIVLPDWRESLEEFVSSQV